MKYKNKILKNKIDQKQVYLDVAKLHMKSIRTGFLTSLGVKFLALMYRSIDEANFSTLIVKYNDSKLVGFVTGSIGTSNLYKIMFHHPLDLVQALFPIIFNINKIKKIFEILKHTSGTKRGKYPKAELLTICVHSDYRRQGVAIDLYRQLSDFFKSKSITKFVIIVGQSLEANSFYKNQGAEKIDKIEIHQNINSNLFIQKL
jgi:ribosomal protein S18 acetylase RimI-like enzyme